MSGTSMDGIDACLLKTDGQTLATAGVGRFAPYSQDMRAQLAAAVTGALSSGTIDALARDLTLAHAKLVDATLAGAGLDPAAIATIGFHGHTIDHAPCPGQPGVGRTVQIGDGALLAATTGIDVVDDFRSADVAAGGEGAPLAPAYHAALASDMAKPLCVVNIGGVANVTWIGVDDDEGETLLAFDTGPGNALIDDFVALRTGAAYDRDGALAATGRVDAAQVAEFMNHPYFSRRPPKSLDRQAFAAIGPQLVALSPADGAATLTAMTAASIAAGCRHLAVPPVQYAVTGGGRKNATLMDMLSDQLPAPVVPVEALGWNGDLLEAQAFAYLAVRSRAGLPISYPGTTGVPAPLTGGSFHAKR